MNKIDEASKFSPLTARLMVRKGEANQTAELGWTLKPSLFAKKGAAKPASVANDAPKSRRLVLTMTPREYETLGLIAVKKGTTRHQLAPMRSSSKPQHSHALCFSTPQLLKPALD